MATEGEAVDPTAGRRPLVSVVIPTHDYAGYVGGAIRSALEQGYRPVEVVVVDDGSTDRTPAVLETFGEAIRRIRLERRGVSAARNAGLEASRGAYVVFLDADDLLVPGGLATQVAHLERHAHVDVVAGEWYVCDVGSGAIVHERTTLSEVDVLPQLLRRNVVATPSAVLLRRSALEAVGGFDTRFTFTADWEMWLRLARHGCRFGAVAAPAAVYRVHPRSMTRALGATIADTTSFLDHVAAPGATRAEIMLYLASLCVGAGDDERAAACLGQALHQDPAALDSRPLYAALVGALFRGRRPGDTDGAEAAARLVALSSRLCEVAGGDRPRRRALRHLAAGVVARSAGDWQCGLGHLARALGASCRAVLQGPQRGWAARLLVPPAWVDRGRRLASTLAARGARETLVPPGVRAALAGESAGEAP